MYGTDIHDGMYRVVQTHKQFDGLGMDVSGKTGTAEVDGVYHPNHGMFVGYAPSTDPQVCNMPYVLKMVIHQEMRVWQLMTFLNTFLNLTDEGSILTGVASSDTSDTSND